MIGFCGVVLVVGRQPLDIFYFLVLSHFVFLITGNCRSVQMQTEGVRCRVYSNMESQIMKKMLNKYNNLDLA